MGSLCLKLVFPNSFQGWKKTPNVSRSDDTEATSSPALAPCDKDVSPRPHLYWLSHHWALTLMSQKCAGQERGGGTLRGQLTLLTYPPLWQVPESPCASVSSPEKPGYYSPYCLSWLWRLKRGNENQVLRAASAHCKCSVSILPAPEITEDKDHSDFALQQP